MKIRYHLAPGWPQFAWIAQLAKDSDEVQVTHGHGVETEESWFCEAIWDGDYQEGTFDKTDIVAGSGARLRDGELVFVPSGSTVDRLVDCRVDDKIYVSNSLTLILIYAENSVPAGAIEYPAAIESAIKDLDQYQRTLQISKTAVNFRLFHNLVWDGGKFSERPKNGQEREFLNFDQYYTFLDTSLQRVLRNGADKGRKIQFSPLCALSSGYDSTAIACIATRHGCRQAISFDRARGGEDDTGRIAAHKLGLELSIFPRDGWKDLPFSEVEFVAADGHGEDRFFSAARSMLSGKALLTGYHGDKVWEKSVHQKYFSDQLVRGDISGPSLTEFRLSAGFINCPVPFWGARQIGQINRISNLPEMEHWCLGGRYDRPICRRIAEQAGIHRECFRQRKKAASILVGTELENCSAGSKVAYHAWIRQHKAQINSQGQVLWLVSPALDTVLCTVPDYLETSINWILNVMKQLPVLWRYADSPRINGIVRTLHNRQPRYLRNYLFPWASELHKQKFFTPQSTDRG